MERHKQVLMTDPDDKTAQDMIDYFMKWKTREEDEWRDPEWQKNNLEYDMRTSKVMVEKVRNDEFYAQNLYAALCNNDFIKNDVWPLLTEKTWSTTWRYAGGIVAHMRGEGDYIDWYCSGIRNDWSDEEYQNASKQDQEKYLLMKTKYASEGHITEEIRKDLFDIGWLPHDGDYKNFED